MLQPREIKYIKHPSFGYATQSQIDRLMCIGVCPERKDIFKQIKKQTNSMKRKKK